MFLSSYLDVFDIEPEHAAEDEVRVGDLVRTGANAYPQFTVVAVSGDTAWVRNIVSGADGFAPLRRCRKLDADPAARLAAE